MSLFTLDGTGIADPTTDTLDLYGGNDGGGSLSSFFGLTGDSVGDGYGYTTSTDSTPSSATSQTLGMLQSGGSNIDWTSIIQGGLSTLVAADSLSHGLTASGQVPTYQAPNGMIYPIGQGPTTGSNGFGLLLIIGLVAFLMMEEKK